MVIKEWIMIDDALSDPWEAQRAALGAFLRTQRELSNMSLRELSRLTRISNAYLSQVERGLHDPTLRILSQIGEALQISMSEILNAAATTDDSTADSVSSTHMPSVEAAVRADPNLTRPEKDALLTVYRSYLNTHKAPAK
jgi:transcriptional regulator with XRE-family HTH domain